MSLSGVLLTALLIWILIDRWAGSAGPDLDGLAVVPPGSWHVENRGLELQRDEDEMARILSLPYLSGTHAAGSRSGVTIHDPARSSAGVNLYVSGHGPEALLLDMEGTLLHRWRLPFESAFGADKAREDTAYWRRAHLLPDGSLLAIFQAGGMVKVDRSSNLVWAVDEGFYNDLEVTGDGQILAIGKAARIIPEINPDEPVLEDSIVVLSPDGEILSRGSLLGMFFNSPFRELLEPMADRGDILHSNTVEWLDGSQVALSHLLRRGNLLVSLREVDIVAIVDPVRRVVEWAMRGPWDAQHQPMLIDRGRLLIFDNQGAAGGASRVVEIDIMSGAIEWQYPPEGAPSGLLGSREAGSSQRLPGGTTLITESEKGRALEVTRGGEVVWEFLSPHRAGEKRNLVASLFEVVRLPTEAVDFLEGEQ